jgi:hypothetical protein
LRHDPKRPSRRQHCLHDCIDGAITARDDHSPVVTNGRFRRALGDACKLAGVIDQDEFVSPPSRGQEVFDLPAGFMGVLRAGTGIADDV